MYIDYSNNTTCREFFKMLLQIITSCNCILTIIITKSYLSSPNLQLLLILLIYVADNQTEYKKHCCVFHVILLHFIDVLLSTAVLHVHFYCTICPFYDNNARTVTVATLTVCNTLYSTPRFTFIWGKIKYSTKSLENHPV